MRYFFNVRAGEALIIDKEGVEVAGLGDAAEEAKQAARDIVAERVKHGDKVDDGVFEVMNAAGAKVMTIPIRSVLRL